MVGCDLVKKRSEVEVGIDKVVLVDFTSSYPLGWRSVNGSLRLYGNEQGRAMLGCESVNCRYLIIFSPLS